MNELLLQEIFNNFTLENISSKWGGLSKDEQSCVLGKCIELGEESKLQYLFEKEKADPNYYFWGGSLSIITNMHGKPDMLEVIFNAGGRFEEEEILNFDDKEKTQYFKFMYKHKASLTAEEVAKFYGIRWEALTSNKKVHRDKWVGFVENNNTEEFKNTFQNNPGSFSTETGIFCLYKSIELNKPEILELLLKNNVDPNIFLVNTSPLQLAQSIFSKIQSKDSEICLNILKNYNAKLTKEEYLKKKNITLKQEDNHDEKEEIKKEVAEKNDQSLSNFLINDFNNANYSKSCMLQQFLKTGELKAANILISKNIHLDGEQIEGLDEAQKVIYNELIYNDTGLIGELDLLTDPA